MKPRRGYQLEFFKTRLVEIIDKEHELVKLSDQVEWSRFTREFGELYVEDVGRPGINTRLMVSLHYLKYLHNLSDDLTVRKWVENPYWQYFSGMEYFEHKVPFNRSSMSRWRGRLTDKQMELFLQESLSVGFKTKCLKPQDLKRVYTDTTVQEKNITFPTDAKLYHKAREYLVKECKGVLELRQSYTRSSKTALIKSSRYRAAKQYRRARKEEKKLHNYLGRTIREMKRNNIVTPSFAICEQVYLSKYDPSKKLYSIHEPQVECIAKGKAQPYEFGVKVSITEVARSGFVLEATAIHGNPYDGHTLKTAVDTATRITGFDMHKAVKGVDLGYRGHGLPQKQVIHPRRKKISQKLRNFINKRGKVESGISCLKRSYRMGKNYLKGTLGDKINALFSAAAYNLNLVIIRKFRTA